MSLEKSPVSFPVHVLRLPQKGMTVRIEADASQRALLAEEHGLLSVESFVAELLVTAWKRRGVQVAGRVTARIVQACVATLEPLESSMDEAVSAVFLPEDSSLVRHAATPGGELHLDAEGPDAPEIFSGDTIDAGAVAEEFFALAIDPYPRSPGAAVAAPPQTDDTAEATPLAALGRLLRKP